MKSTVSMSDIVNSVYIQICLLQMKKLSVEKGGTSLEAWLFCVTSLKEMQ